jgi:hypothetical protein
MEFHRGDLLRDVANDRESAELKSLRHPPIVLDATLDAIIQTLERAEKSDSTHADV